MPFTTDGTGINTVDGNTFEAGTNVISVGLTPNGGTDSYAGAVVQQIVTSGASGTTNGVPRKKTWPDDAGGLDVNDWCTQTTGTAAQAPS